MVPPADDEMVRLASRPRREKCHLFVSTFGGQAQTPYRIMRCLRHAYSHITVVVAGPCKSAGTLLVIGADEIVMTGGGELGPLDVQILKDDELLARQSGNAPSYAFEKLREEAQRAFQSFYVDMKVRGNLTTATAAETSATLTIGLLSPIFAQMDPIRIGEMAMANLVAHRYATELLKHDKSDRANIDKDGIERLLYTYPSHDYVIDRTEAKQVFKRVRHPTDHENKVINLFRAFMHTPHHEPLTFRFPSETTKEVRSEQPEHTSSVSSGDPGPDISSPPTSGDPPVSAGHVEPTPEGHPPGPRRRRRGDTKPRQNEVHPSGGASRDGV